MQLPEYVESAAVEYRKGEFCDEANTVIEWVLDVLQDITDVDGFGMGVERALNGDDKN